MTWPFGDLKRAHYRAILIDPPHKFSAGTKTRPQHYARMTDHEIAALPVHELFHPEGGWLFYWTLASKLYAPPGSRTQLNPQQIAGHWKCRWSSRAFLWVKLTRRESGLFVFPDSYHRGLGLTTAKNAEDCLLFRYRNAPRRRGVAELVVSPVREHSRKPDEVAARIERFCDGPYLELFARECRPGWDSWGNEVGKFEVAA
jgi:N6-adenosine-specific RNA methylase IME4